MYLCPWGMELTDLSASQDRPSLRARSHHSHVAEKKIRNEMASRREVFDQVTELTTASPAVKRLTSRQKVQKTCDSAVPCHTSGLGHPVHNSALNCAVVREHTCTTPLIQRAYPTVPRLYTTSHTPDTHTRSCKTRTRSPLAQEPITLLSYLSNHRQKNAPGTVHTQPLITGCARRLSP